MKREDVKVSMGTKTLCGSLWIPVSVNDLGKYPAVVFSHGGGPQNRGGYGATFEDKPCEMAQFFIDNGYMVALWDKPGTGESTGSWESEHLAGCADNLVAVVEWTKSIESSNGTVGVWGLSQGGMVGPVAGSKSKSIDFVISVSSSWVSRHEQEVFRIQHTLRRDSMNDRQIEEAILVTNEYHALELKHAQWDDVLSLCRAHKGKDWYDTSFLWYISQWGEGRYIANCNEAGDIALDMGFLKSLCCPVLFQWGLDDQVVDARRNRQIVETSIPSASKGLFAFESYEGCDHGLCKHGKSVPDVVYRDLVGWLRSIGQAPNKAIHRSRLRRPGDP